MKMLFNLVVAVLNLLVHMADKRYKRRKEEVKPRISLIETLFGYPAYVWFNLRFFPGKVSEEVDLFLHEQEQTKGKGKEIVNYHKYKLSSAGLWLPANR